MQQQEKRWQRRQFPSAGPSTQGLKSVVTLGTVCSPKAVLFFRIATPTLRDSCSDIDEQAVQVL
jgi:hypothetical protein